VVTGLSEVSFVEELTSVALFINGVVAVM